MKITVLTLAAAAALAACSAAPAPHPTAGPVTAPVTSSPTTPAGCQQATAALLGIRQAGHSAAAVHQLMTLMHALPTGILQIKVGAAAERLTRLRLDASEGKPASSDAKDYEMHLDAIAAYCG